MSTTESIIIHCVSLIILCFIVGGVIDLNYLLWQEREEKKYAQEEAERNLKLYGDLLREKYNLPPKKH